MAHSLRYWKELEQANGSVVRLEIYEKNGSAPAVEIGKVVQAMHLDIQGGADSIDAPIVKTSLTMAFVDAPDLNDGKCGDWQEFYTSDSTKWKVVLLAKNAGGSFRTIWGGYVTPDSYAEQLRYRGSVTIIARDNIGHLQDFPFDLEGNADGMVTLYDLVNAAWSKIESPMTLDWRHEGDDANYLLCNGVEAPQTYLNVSAFEDMTWYDAVERALYAYGLVMRYVGRNYVSVMSLRDLPKQGKEEPRYVEPTFIAGAERELAPAAKRIEESVKYEFGEGMHIPLAREIEFSGAEQSCPFYSTNIFGETTKVNIPVHPIARTSGEGWSNVASSTLFFNPARYTIRDARLQEDVKRMIFLAANTDDSRSVVYRRNIYCSPFKVEIGFGRVVTRNGNGVSYCYGFASGTEDNGIGAIRVKELDCYIAIEQNGITKYYDGYNWSTEAYRITLQPEGGKVGVDVGFNGITGGAELSVTIERIVIDSQRDYSDGDGMYVPINSMQLSSTDALSLCETNNVNTVYIEGNNVILDHNPEIAPALNDVPFPNIIKNGIFVKDGAAYLPAKEWAWRGGTPQQMAVYNHLQLLCYHAKPNNVITGDIVTSDFVNLECIYEWGGAEHLLVSGTYNFISGRIESAVLREFAWYESMWGDASGKETPLTEQDNQTVAESSGGSSSSNTYRNDTTVVIGGSGSSVPLDTEMSDYSENAVQNKIIKAYVDGKAKEAQAAAEQYIQNEVLTDYATTKYVGEREEYLVGYAEGLVSDLEKDIDGRGYLTSAAMTNYATKDDIKNFVVKGTTLAHYGITDAVRYEHNISPTTTGLPAVMSYVGSSAGWKGGGPAMLWGTNGYYTRLNVLIEPSDSPNMYISNVYNFTEYGWAKVLTEKNIRSHAIEIAPASERRSATDTSAFTTYAYGDNGWNGAGPALAFPNGTYKGLIQLTYAPDNAYMRMYIGGVRPEVDGNILPWTEVVTKDNIASYAVAMNTFQSGIDLNEIEAGLYDLAGAITNSPSNYGSLLNIKGYFSAQLLFDVNGAAAYYRTKSDREVDGTKWRPWQTIITQSSGDDRYLKLSGGTLTGQLYVQNSAGDRYIHSKCDTAHIAFGVGSGGINRGIYDINDNKWWIVRNNSDYTEIVSSTMSLVGKVNVTGLLEARSGITLGNVTRTSWPAEGIAKNSILLPNNAFDNFGKIQFSQLDNALYAAYERYTVDVSGFSSSEPSCHRRLFDGAYEGDYNKVSAGGTGVITIGDGVNPIIKDAGYPYGDIVLSFYYTNIPESATVEVYSTYEPHGIGWHTLSRKEVRGSNGGVWIYNNLTYGITQLRITVNASATIDTNLVEIDWFLTRASLSNLPVVTKFAIDQELWGRLICKGGITLGSKTITSWSDFITSDGGTINAGKYLNIGSASLAYKAISPDYLNKLVISGLVSIGNLYMRERLYIEASAGLDARIAFRDGNGTITDYINSFDDLRIKVVERTETSGVSIAPNVLNRWTTPLTDALTINFSAGRTGVANYYMMEFTTGATVPTITLPSGITWQGGDNILSRLEPNKTYQISVLNNLAVGGAF